MQQTPPVVLASGTRFGPVFENMPKNPMMLFVSASFFEKKLFCV